MSRHFDTAVHDWSILTMDGPDVSSFLNRLLAANAPQPGSGDSVVTALLTPQGKIQHQLFLHAPTGQTALHLHYWKPQGEALLNRLNMLKLRAKLEITPLQDWAVRVSDAPFDGGFADPRGPEATLYRGAVEDPRHDAESLDRYHQRRIEHGLPEQGQDFGFEDRWPTDVNMDLQGGADAKKGCFIGQEVVSRMLRKGGVRKRLVRVSSDHGPLEKTSLTTLEGAPLGEVTSVSGSIGLAIIRMDRLGEANRARTARGEEIGIHTAHLPAAAKYG